MLAPHRARYELGLAVARLGCFPMECKDYVDLSIKDDDLELLRSMFDKEQDKSLSDIIKRLVDAYKNIIDC